MKASQKPEELKAHVRKLKFGSLLALCACAAALVPAHLRADDIGLTSLKIGIGTRECGMGDAGTVGATGPQSIYWNPALNARANGFAASFSYADWFLDMSKSAIFVSRTTPYFVLGLGATLFNAGKVEYRGESPSDDPLGTFNPFDYNIYLNFSRSFGRIGLGLTGHYYYQRILDRSASGFGTDLGFTYDFTRRLRIGASVLDFGPTMQFRFSDFLLPTRSQLGVVYSLPIGHSELSATADADYYFFNRDITVGLGGEFVVNKAIALRAGYRLLDPTEHLTLGLGFRVKNFRIDYAFAAHDLNLGATHRFSVGLGY